MIVASTSFRVIGTVTNDGVDLPVGLIVARSENEAAALTEGWKTTLGNAAAAETHRLNFNLPAQIGTVIDGGFSQADVDAAHATNLARLAARVI